MDDIRFVGSLLLSIVLLVLVLGVPAYLMEKSSCETFAELQQTESKFTLNGDCYVRLSNGSWVDKGRWFFYESINH